jgi:hypothetical protein
MRKLTHALFLLGALSAFACGGNEDSLGTKGDNQNGNDKCEGTTDPSTLGCGNGTTCPTGMVCDPNACHPSLCSCDAATGDWMCTADCGQGSCVPDNGNPVCDSPDPSQGCDNGCGEGFVCDPNVCRPSSCSCSESGDWLCTKDCGSGGACVPKTDPVTCEGTDPSLGCDAGCAVGEVCDPNACRPSSCGCDPVTGGWICTADCGEGGACMPDTTKACSGPDPSAGCDNGCPTGYSCDPNGCQPSICSCDPTSGWLCTADCGDGGQCVKD